MSELINKFIHQKLSIKKLDENGKEIGDQPGESFQVMFNPTHYQEKFGVDVVCKTLIDGSEYLTYKQLQDQTLEFELLFDESYVNEYVWRRLTKSFDSVATQIENFKKTTGYPLAGENKPNQVKLEWGGNNFKDERFFLQSMVLNHLIFNRSGNPIRTKANAIFRRVNTLKSEQADNSGSGSKSAPISKLELKIG